MTGPTCRMVLDDGLRCPGEPLDPDADMLICEHCAIAVALLLGLELEHEPLGDAR